MGGNSDQDAHDDEDDIEAGGDDQAFAAFFRGLAGKGHLEGCLGQQHVDPESAEPSQYVLQANPLGISHDRILFQIGRQAVHAGIDQEGIAQDGEHDHVDKKVDGLGQRHGPHAAGNKIDV